MPRQYGTTGLQATATVPTAPVAGQTYFDPNAKVTYVYDGGAWVALSGGIAASYVQSRETNQVTNGTGFLKTNQNFSAFTYIGSDAPAGITGSFQPAAGVSGSPQIDEYVVVNPNKECRLSFFATQKNSIAGGGYFYGLVAPYDAYLNSIQPYHYMYIAGTDTTLAVDLINGATTITLTDSTNWYGTAGKPAGANGYNRNIMFWDYTDPGGKLWPVHQYTRNLGSTSGIWADGGITGNVITLSAPWAGGTHVAGTPVNNATAGGSYLYMPSCTNVRPPVGVWTPYADSIQGVVPPSGVGASFTVGWPAATALAKIGWLVNRTASGPSDATSTHAVAGVSYGDAAAAAYDANNINASTQVTSGTLPVARGGTGSSTAPTPGGVAYGQSATALTTTPAGTAGQVLTSGGAGAPVWVNGQLNEIAIAGASPGSPAGYDLWVDTSTGMASDSILALLENPPRCAMARTAVLTVGAGAWTVVPWDTTNENPGGIWVSGSPTRMTIPTAGLYHIDMNTLFAAVANVQRQGVSIYQNGIAVKSMLNLGSAATALAVGVGTLSADLRCAAGDYIEMYVFATIAQTLPANNAFYNYANIRWVCP